MEAAVVWWTCSCGIKVKAVLDLNKAGATVECADPSCRSRRTLPGQITRLSVETERDVWRVVDVNWLVYPPEKTHGALSALLL